MELLVGNLERALDGTGAVVESPGWLFDRDSESDREVDVVVRQRVGSVDVVVMLECRDRRETAGVDWIEQVASKRNGVGAARAVAVSTSGFSSGARRKALSLGVELREVVEVESREVLEWLQLREMRLSLMRSSVVSASVVAFDVGWSPRVVAGIQALSGAPLGHAAFVSDTDGERLSVLDLWDRFSRDLECHEGVPEDGRRVERTFRIKRLQRFPVVVEEVRVPVRYVELQVQLWIEKSVVPLHRVVAYQKDEETLVESAEYVLELDGEEGVASFTWDPRTRERGMVVRGDFEGPMYARMVKVGDAGA